VTKLIEHEGKCKETSNRQPVAGCQVGHLVSSTRGRDYGRFYLVLGIEDGRRVRVADGEVRKVEKAKRKNVKHLKFYGVTANEVAEKALSGKKIANTDVRNELKSLVNQLYACNTGGSAVAPPGR